MRIFEYAYQHHSGLATSLLDVVMVEKLIIEATHEYCAWGSLKYSGENALIDGNTVLSLSEWGVIKPLAELFIEREGALIQEASRVASHEPYGRSSSEIAQDIQNYRLEYLPVRAFGLAPCTI